MVFNTLLSFRTVIHHALAKSKKKIVFFFIRVDKSGHRVTCTWLIKKNSLFEEKEGEKHNTKKSRLHSILRTFIISIAFSILVQICFYDFLKLIFLNISKIVLGFTIEFSFNKCTEKKSNIKYHKFMTYFAMIS